ncbi:MAG: hypothetical protein ABJC98_10585 [Bacteroidota bacterium]
MNRLLIIFTAYLLILSCFPCMCDDAQEIHTKRVEINASASAGNNNKDDGCHSFCSCSCCLSSTFFYQKELQVEAPLALYDIVEFNRADGHFISYNANAIWQPPKLS